MAWMDVPSLWTKCHGVHRAERQQVTTLANTLTVMEEDACPVNRRSTRSRQEETFVTSVDFLFKVLANAYAAHMDPKYWTDPLNFRPERFLVDKRTIIGSEDVIPFGLGKRSCLGEILARQEVFLFLTSLFQGFDILPPEGQDSIKVNDVIAISMSPSEFKVRLISRIEDKKRKK